MQSVSSRIWTRVAVYISYDDNQDTTGTSIYSVYSNVIFPWRQHSWNQHAVEKAA